MTTNVKISLEKISPSSKRNAELFDLLTHDAKLLEEGIGLNEKISFSDFKKHNQDWAAKNKAESFAIVAENITVGMISLSHIDLNKKEACIGYFIGGKFRNRGCATKAFEMIVNRAKKLGLKKLHSTINKDNLASISIWKKYNSSIEERGYNLYLTLELGNICPSNT
jgi:RimJ/RimL family protein N-acetyltransferase